MIDERTEVEVRRDRESSDNEKTNYRRIVRVSERGGGKGERRRERGERGEEEGERRR